MAFSHEQPTYYIDKAESNKIHQPPSDFVAIPISDAESEEAGAVPLTNGKSTEDNLSHDKQVSLEQLKKVMGLSTGPISNWYSLVLGAVTIPAGIGVSAYFGVNAVGFLTSWAPYVFAGSPLLQLAVASLVRPFAKHDQPGAKDLSEAIKKALQLTAFFSTTTGYIISNLANTSLGWLRFLFMIGSVPLNVWLNMNSVEALFDKTLPKLFAHLKEGWEKGNIKKLTLETLSLSVLTAVFAIFSLGASTPFFLVVSENAAKVIGEKRAQNMAVSNIALFLINAFALLLPSSITLLIDIKKRLTELFDKSSEKEIKADLERLQEILNNPAKFAIFIEKLEKHSKLAENNTKKEIKFEEMHSILQDVMGEGSPIVSTICVLIAAASGGFYWWLGNNEILTHGAIESWPVKVKDFMLKMLQAMKLPDYSIAPIANITNLLFSIKGGYKGMQILRTFLADLTKCEITLRRFGIDFSACILAGLSIGPTLAMGEHTPETLFTYLAALNAGLVNLYSAPEEAQKAINTILTTLKMIEQDPNNKEEVSKKIKSGLEELQNSNNLTPGAIEQVFASAMNDTLTVKAIFPQEAIPATGKLESTPLLSSQPLKQVYLPIFMTVTSNLDQPIVPRSHISLQNSYGA